MSIRFIIGRSGYGKTEKCLQEMQTKLRDEPQGAPLIYLVPDQMTFQSERALATSANLSGMIRAQVFSFSRLAWKVLQETGGLARTHLTTVGTNMLLRKIIEKNKGKLLAFQNAANKVGFIDKTAEIMTEFKRYLIEPSDFYISEQETEENKSFRHKVHDLQFIYEQFELELMGKYVDSEDYLTLLAEHIDNSPYLNNAQFWVDGFHSFTPNEYVVLEALMKHTDRVSMTVTMDGLPSGIPSELDLFHENIRNYRRLLSIASEANVSVEEPLLLQQPHRFHHESLAFIEKEYERRPAKSYPEEPNVHLAAAVNRRAEVEAIARKILSLVRDQHYRYRDISLIVRNLEDYEDLFETIFVDYELPFFRDEKRPMLHHPLIEFIRSLFDIVTGNWRYEAMFRAIKTDFFIPVDEFEHVDAYREQFDQLENFVLKLGMQGSRWKNDELWKKQLKSDVEGTGKQKGAANLWDLRELVNGPLSQFEQEIKQATTGREMTEALYQLLIALHVPEKMTEWLIKAEEQSRLTEALEHEQAWKEVMSLLDEIVEVIGDETMTFTLFSEMIAAGLESMKFALVPPALDQVLIGSLDRSRYTNVKCVFLIGANEGVLPAKPKEDGLLTEREREQLAESGVVLAPGSKRRLLDEQFYIYLALTTAEEKLWVSYPLADAEGKSLFPSPLITRFHEWFPTVEEKLWLLDSAEETEADELLLIANPHKTLSFLASQLRLWRRGYPIRSFWWDAYNWFIEKGHARETRLLLTSLFYENKAEPLTKETSLALYGDVVQVSVSRMERFQSCPYQQFASHGLRLKERQLFRLNAPDIGQLFHAALSLIAEELQHRHIEWASLNEQESYEIASRVIDFLAPTIQNDILLSSSRHYYLTRKLKQVVGRATKALALQARQSGFSPVGLELGFGQDSPLPAIVYELDNGTKLEVAGRIDRVDRAHGDQGMLLRIIDYKSSTRELSLAEMYFGISMQMLTYLDVVITHAPQWLGQEAIPAGVLYFHVHNPMLNTSGAVEGSTVDSELFKSFKMKGLVLDDLEAISLMDDTASEQDSQIIPVGFRKDGQFKKNSKIASEQQFNQIRSHIRKLTQSIGTEMTNGLIEISPYRLKNQTPCTFCEYRSVCQFDQSLDSNQFRLIRAEKDEDILKKIHDEREEEQ